MSTLTIREKLEQREFNNLSDIATKSANATRKVEEERSDLRTDFQRDRDRILHSKAFRRLKHKTQVFLSPFDDHFRTRLTHTLEVSQIGRTIARALDLNEDLVEAISLGHDLGHTPFGHCGESVLNELVDGGFHHNIQSVRVVEVLENLNLCKETIDGIFTHTWGYTPKTPEGQVVQLADKIAYINHDIEDAIRAGILKLSSLPKHFQDIIGGKISGIINALVSAVIENSYDGIITLGPSVGEAFRDVHEFMYKNVYLDKKSISEEHKVPFVISSLYNHFKNNSNQIPEYLRILNSEEGLDRAVCDYIAGMTDQFAISLFKDIFLPRSSKIF